MVKDSCDIRLGRRLICPVCRRLYCSNCLTKGKDRVLCNRCIVFTTRPLSKIELLKLKAKDLIFYLQSKHISTTGCVGKCVVRGENEGGKMRHFQTSFRRICAKNARPPHLVLALISSILIEMLMGCVSLLSIGEKSVFNLHAVQFSQNSTHRERFCYR